MNSLTRGLPPHPPRPFSPVKARGRRGAKRFFAIANSPASKPGGEGGPSVFLLSRTRLRQSPGAKGGQAFFRYRELSCVKAWGRRGAKRMGGGIKQEESRVTRYSTRLSVVGRRFHPKISAERSGYSLRNLRLLSSWTRRIHIATE